MRVKSESKVVKSCPTLRDPMDGSLPGPSVHGILQARAPEWVAITFSSKFPKYKQILFREHIHKSNLFVNLTKLA